LAHRLEQLGNRLVLHLVDRLRAEGGENVQPQHRLVGAPAALVALDVRQIAVAHELAQGRGLAQRAALLLGVFADQRLREDEPRLAPRLVEGEDLGGAELELAFAAAGIGVALVERLAARGADFQHESTLIGVEEIDLRTARRTGRSLRELAGEMNSRHYQTLALKRNATGDLPISR